MSTMCPRRKRPVMREASSWSPKRVVVIGGSMAGMLAAAAVKDHVDSVEIIEAHELPAGPEPRIGVPQAVHIHWLQTGGAEAVEALLPGSTGLLLAAGAHRIPVTTNMVIRSPEGWYRRWQRATHYVITASRDLTDFVIREQVLKDPRVSVHTQTKAVGLLGDRHTVTGVRVQDTRGTEAELRADLIIDACGRATRMPQWLKGLGITSLTEEHVDSGLAYASRIYRAPVPTRGWPVVGVQADPRSPEPGKAGGILPIEGDRWHVSLMVPPAGTPPVRRKPSSPLPAPCATPSWPISSSMPNRSLASASPAAPRTGATTTNGSATGLRAW